MMDESYLLACAKYILLNPVRAKLVKAPKDWPWSSIKYHLNGKDDILFKLKQMLYAEFSEVRLEKF